MLVRGNLVLAESSQRPTLLPALPARGLRRGAPGAEPGDGGPGGEGVPARLGHDTHPEHRWFVRIDNWHPCRLNELIHAHWAKAARKKRIDRDILALAVAGAGVPAARGKRRVGLEITLGPRRRAADPDAYWKGLLDGLVHCGALVNDSPAWVELLPVQYLRGGRNATVLFLADVPEEELPRSRRTPRVFRHPFVENEPVREEEEMPERPGEDYFSAL